MLVLLSAAYAVGIGGGEVARKLDLRPSQIVPAADTLPVRNLIYLIGDGMGLSHVSMLMLEEGYGTTAFDRAQNIALITTYSANNRVTDSAAAGTALATGHKTGNGMLGVLPDSTAAESIMADAGGDRRYQYSATRYARRFLCPCALSATVSANFRSTGRKRLDGGLRRRIEVCRSVGAGGRCTGHRAPSGSRFPGADRSLTARYLEPGTCDGILCRRSPAENVGGSGRLSGAGDPQGAGDSVARSRRARSGLCSDGRRIPD